MSLPGIPKAMLIPAGVTGLCGPAEVDLRGPGSGVLGALY